MQQCQLCNDKPKDKSSIVCDKCRKSARAIIKEFTTYQEFIEYKCGHKSFGSNRGWRRVPRYSSTGLPLGNLNIERSYEWDEKPKSSCPVCREEIRKELTLRRTKYEKKCKNIERKNESLMQMCCRVIARDPGLILIAAGQTSPPIPDKIWKCIYDEVPAALTKEYNEILDASMEENDARWMYSTIGEVFSRYVKRRRDRF